METNILDEKRQKNSLCGNLKMKKKINNSVLHSSMSNSSVFSPIAVERFVSPPSRNQNIPQEEIRKPSWRVRVLEGGVVGGNP